MARFGTAECSVCLREFALKMDGTISKHYAPNTATMCAGADQRPLAQATYEIDEPEDGLEFSDEASDGRVNVPLRMFRGNIEILLENRIPCQGVSFMRDPEYRNAIILVFHGTDKEVADSVGFKTAPLRKFE